MHIVRLGAHDEKRLTIASGPVDRAGAVRWMAAELGEQGPEVALAEHNAEMASSEMELTLTAGAIW